MVISRNVTRGQTVASSLQTPTLFLVDADLTQMQVDANVSESDIGGVKQDDAASFAVDARASSTEKPCKFGSPRRRCKMSSPMTRSSASTIAISP